ncbi:molybdopterin-binding protein [Haloarcula amylovorans]|uniref:molybdopterin-binding protein n=1 Tax=Haloarcula amylovorans TaxID=2562280 RepID=UPI001076123C|nr:molybdopterin-binding protein [Halomicroarcula amylolytica]
MTGPAPTDRNECTLETARRQLGSYAVPVDRTDRVPLSVAVGRVLADDATADEAVPDANIAVGDAVFERGWQLRPADLGLLKAAGRNELHVRQRPQVGVVPTGDELVQREAAEGERVETSGFTLAQYADRWGAKVTYRDVVADDAPALRMAVQRDLTCEVIVLTGTEPGDTLREVIADLGDLIADRVAISPGHETGLAVVEDRPVLLLPESTVAARVGAVQLLRPLVKAFGGAPFSSHPTADATLTEVIETTAARRVFVPVSHEQGTATPLSGIDLGSATRADGWVTVPEETERVAAGETVAVENWDFLP